MAWPTTHVSTDFDPGDQAGSKSGNTFAQGLYDRQDSVAQRGQAGVSWLNATTTSSTYAAVGEQFRVRMPSFMDANGCTVELFVWVVADQAMTADIYLYNVTDASAGTTEQHVFGAAGDESGICKYTFSSDVSGTFKTFQMYGQTTAGTLRLQTRGDEGSGYDSRGQLRFAPA